MNVLYPCCYCKRRLPRESFYFNRGRSTGVSSGCKPCALTYASEWNRAHKPHIAERDKRRAAKRAETTRRWHKANRERMNAYMRAWNKKGGRRPGPRSMAMLTPPWANRFFIGEIYALARLRTKVTGTPWEVDHFIPLNGENVCGLHVENNLRVVPRFVNRSKKNRIEENRTLP